MRVLVTRPEPEGERTATLLRSRGHDVVLEPLLRIEPVAEAAWGAGPWQAALLTSTNAARAIAAHRRARELAGLPAYVVGTRTRAAAVAAGFDPVVSADGDVGDLVALVAARASTTAGPLIHLAAEERAGDLAGELEARGFAVETAVVYRAVTVTAFTPRVRELLAGGRIDVVLHYSPRSAAAFVAALAAARIADSSINIKHLCLSSAVAAPLAAAGARTIVTAHAPNEAALLERLDGV
jgi:uroporphyrinogen-III synthase